MPGLSSQLTEPLKDQSTDAPELTGTSTNGSSERPAVTAQDGIDDTPIDEELPDLVLENIQYSPTTADVGDTITWTMDVRNIGGGNIHTAFDIGMFDVGGGLYKWDQAPLNVVRLSSLEKDGIESISFTTTATPDHAYWFGADSGEEIKETIEQVEGAPTEQAGGYTDMNVILGS